MSINGQCVERIHSFKLLGAYLSDDLTWNTQVDHILKKANSRLFVLRLLKKAGLGHTDVITIYNLVPRACDPREGTRGSGIIRCRKPGILSKIELHIPFQRPIRFLPETDYPRASRSFRGSQAWGTRLNHLLLNLVSRAMPVRGLGWHWLWGN
jgi:hypothetical protein